MSPSSYAEVQLGQIPSGDLLKDLPEFGSGKASEGAEVGSAAANILSQLGEGKSVCKPPTSMIQKHVPMGSGLAGGQDCLSTVRGFFGAAASQRPDQVNAEYGGRAHSGH